MARRACLATSVRIAEMEVGTVGVDVLQRGFDNGLRKEPLSPIDAFGNLTMMLSPKRAPALTDAIADVKPSLRESLFVMYSRDLLRGTGGGGVLGKLEDAVHALNWHHRVRDYFFRRAFFAESLQRRLAEEGRTLMS